IAWPGRFVGVAAVRRRPGPRPVRVAPPLRTARSRLLRGPARLQRLHRLHRRSLLPCPSVSRLPPPLHNTETIIKQSFNLTIWHLCSAVNGREAAISDVGQKRDAFGRSFLS